MYSRSSVRSVENESVDGRAVFEEKKIKIDKFEGHDFGLYDDLGENLYFNCLCILSKHSSIISVEVKVRVDKHIFNVRAREVLGWGPCFTVDDSTSSITSNEPNVQPYFHKEDASSVHFIDDVKKYGWSSTRVSQSSGIELNVFAILVTIGSEDIGQIEAVVYESGY
ncbi:hypothetical protein L1887_00329 [Cichorium endivia]|nr:hypothetical protein L1887_00329 [Cichorium endivia]